MKNLNTNWNRKSNGHQRRVTKIACAIAGEMGFTKDRMEGLRVARILHDIGKICVPAEILSKPSKLNTIELELIKTHSNRKENQIMANA